MGSVAAEEAAAPELVFRSKLLDIEIPSHLTLQAYCFERLPEVASRPCLIDGQSGAVYTYAEVEELSRRAAAGLRRLGVGKGDVVMNLLRKCPEFGERLAPSDAAAAGRRRPGDRRQATTTRGHGQVTTRRPRAGDDDAGPRAGDERRSGRGQATTRRPRAGDSVLSSVLMQGKMEVVKWSLLSSVLSNLLLVLGTSLFCGGLANLGVEQQRSRDAAAAGRRRTRSRDAAAGVANLRPARRGRLPWPLRSS